MVLYTTNPYCQFIFNPFWVGVLEIPYPGILPGLCILSPFGLFLSKAMAVTSIAIEGQTPFRVLKSAGK